MRRGKKKKKERNAILPPPPPFLVPNVMIAEIVLVKMVNKKYFYFKAAFVRFSPKIC